MVFRAEKRAIRGVGEHELSDGNIIRILEMDDESQYADETVHEIWKLRPSERQWIKIHGEEVPIPRRQKAYGRDYAFAGQTSKADPIPLVLQPYLEWAQQNVCATLNGLLLNWYDGALKEYIGAHHDDDRQLVAETPIVTLSLGEDRIFRLSRYEATAGKLRPVEHVDTVVYSGSGIEIPLQTNSAWKHSVPYFVRYKRRRISITLRAFR
ncbi:MAG: alkylated DNA repair dioxygenase AlkB [Pirellulaceae bacterium]|jgi:alkylated DNA repair dioxygenase AlkB